MKSARETNIRYHATKNTKLAAGLAAMNVPFHESPFEKVGTKNGFVVIWRFAMQTECGHYKTGDLIDWWHNDDWFSENYPKHPWALVMSGILTVGYLTQKIKEEPQKVIVRKKSQTWLVYENSDLHKRLENQL